MKVMMKQQIKKMMKKEMKKNKKKKLLFKSPPFSVKCIENGLRSALITGGNL
jgi:hypothetical protein